MSLILDEHREYLSDRPRVKAYRDALREQLRPGDVAVDIGAGTGILGLLACEAGASRVYSIDEGSIAELTREIYRSNGMEGRATVLKGLSTRIDLPELADVVVADQIGRFGFEPGILEFFADAKERFLRPGGRAIPSRIDLWIALVEAPAMMRRVKFWGRRQAGFSFEPAVSIAENTGYPVRLLREDLLSKPLRGACLDTLNHGRARISISETLVVARTGELHGIGGWFSAQMSPSVTMTNSPLSRRRINRRNVFFPLTRPVRVVRGDRVEVEFTILPHEYVVSWSVKVWPAAALGGRARAKVHDRHSTAMGMLISREDLARTDPGSVPSLSPWGKARQTVLELCDGKRTLGEIERGVFARHGALFRTRADAAAFTAEVVTRYAR